ncbi:pyroglutamyl-peptidase I family protein [Brachybacterium huguangmaarense]
MAEILLSGFEPFAGADTNESWEAVRLAARQLRDEGHDADALLLPVEFARAGELLVERTRELRPRIVVAAGLAAGRRAITPERVAINVRDARIPDNAGLAPVDEPCVAVPDVGWFSTLPVKAMATAAELAGAPAQVSQTAGTFVCNDVFALLMHALGADPALAGTRGGFVHVPAADDLPIAVTARALALMSAVALTSEADEHRAAGAEH